MNVNPQARIGQDVYVTVEHKRGWWRARRTIEQARVVAVRWRRGRQGVMYPEFLVEWHEPTPDGSGIPARAYVSEGALAFTEDVSLP